jgi:hypothetical protein
MDVTDDELRHFVTMADGLANSLLTEGLSPVEAAGFFLAYGHSLVMHLHGKPAADAWLVRFAEANQAGVVRRKKDGVVQCKKAGLN